MRTERKRTSSVTGPATKFLNGMTDVNSRDKLGASSVAKRGIVLGLVTNFSKRGPKKRKAVSKSGPKKEANERPGA